MEHPSAPRQHSRLRPWLFAISATLITGFAVLMSGVTGWSDLNSVHQDIDIATGRVRQTRYLFNCKITESLHDTILTRWLPPEKVAVARPAWRRVNTFSGFSDVSPHHAFHGAISDLQRLEATNSLAAFTEDAKRTVAEKVVGLWQAKNDDSVAGDYITRLRSKATGFWSTQGKILTVGNLPQ
jgi:hypothetical protein